MSRRGLTPWEIGEGRRVFGEALAWDRVQIVEEAAWPRWLSNAAARMRRQPPPAHNAVTLGHRLYFSRPLRTNPEDPQSHRRSDMAWLVHELTHVWQIEHYGASALWRLILLHLRTRADPYPYGGEHGLSDAASPKTLAAFNLEQQGEIARDYYARLEAGQDTRAWERIVLPLRSA